MARSKKDFERIYGGKERVAWIASKPCVVCGVTARVENAHVKSGGMGRKAGYQYIVPLCWEHHRGLHQNVHKTFEATYALNLAVLAAMYQAEWERLNPEGK